MGKFKVFPFHAGMCKTHTHTHTDTDTDTPTGGGERGCENSDMSVIYSSRDIKPSLDYTFAVFGQTLNSLSHL